MKQLEQFKKDFPCFWRVSVKGIITNDDGDILLIKEKGGMFDGYRDLPGGGVDHSETNLIEALKREIKEELGWEIVDYDERPSFAWNIMDITPYFLVGYKIKTNEVNKIISNDSSTLLDKEEFSDMRFFNKNNLPKTHPIIKKFFELI